MNARQLSDSLTQYVGRTGMMEIKTVSGGGAKNTPPIVIPVRVLSACIEFVRTYLTVTPVGGSGSARCEPHRVVFRQPEETNPDAA